MDLALQIGIFIFVSLVIFLAIGVPISISIGLSSTIAMLVILPFDGAMGTSAQRVFIGTNSFSLLAIPFLF